MVPSYIIGYLWRIENLHGFTEEVDICPCIRTRSAGISHNQVWSNPIGSYGHLDDEFVVQKSSFSPNEANWMTLAVKFHSPYYL